MRVLLCPPLRASWTIKQVALALQSEIIIHGDHLGDIYRITSESSLFVQVIDLTLKELMKSPLLESVLRDGKRGKCKYDGLIQKLGGFNVGRGVLMVPLENLSTLTRYLEKEKTGCVIRYVWA